MAKKNIGNENKPNASNKIEDVVVAISKTKVITPQDILTTLYRDNASNILPGIMMSAFLLCPMLCVVFLVNETIQWYYYILPVFLFIWGILVIWSVVFSFIKTRMRRKHILNGDFIVKSSKIYDVYSEYNSPGECDDYYINVRNGWIKVPEKVAKKGEACQLLYLLEGGKEQLFLIYIGSCKVEKNLEEMSYDD